MSIQLNKVLTTDTVENGRIIWTDNFTIINDIINNILNYIDVDFGILNGLSNLESIELKVNGTKLIINNSSFIINDNPVINGKLTVNGNLIESNILNTVINDNSPEVAGGIYPIGSVSSAPLYYIYTVTSGAVGGLRVNLYPGVNGQKVKVLFVNNDAGAETLVNIYSAGAGVLYVPSTKEGIKLTELGQSVELIWIQDGWYINGGNSYSFIDSI